ncbi:MAG: nucleotidyl transferase AbiEii/AbiGii toxin family protein [Steroidobacterales bacterium]
MSVLRAFQDAQVRYVLVGGLAVLLHGVDRLTADIDLVVDLAPEQAAKAIETLLALGFRTSAPVDARLFADPATRKRWREESSMVVMSFWDPQNRCPTVDLFAEYPMEFEKMYAGSVLMPLSGTDVRIASVEHLIEIKRAAARPKDLEDAARLARLSHEKKP